MRASLANSLQKTSWFIGLLISALLVVVVATTYFILLDIEDDVNLQMRSSDFYASIPMHVTVASEQRVGRPLRVEIANAAGMRVYLFLTTSYGLQAYETELDINGRATVIIPAEDTTVSGSVVLTVSDDYEQVDREIRLLPEAPVDPVTPLVGARSIIADGAHWAMVVAVPFDRFGNPMDAGLPVRVRSRHPGNWVEEDTVPIKHLLAHKKIWSGTLAGRTFIAIDVEGARGPEGVLEEVPGWPVVFGLESNLDFLPADGRQLVTIRSDVIVDKFGNAMPDGTVVMFTVTDDLGRASQLPGYTIDGRAEIPIQAPVASGSVDVRASLYGVQSLPLELTFTDGPAVNDLRIESRISTVHNEIAVTVGPVLGSLGQFVPDGTIVDITVTFPDGRITYLDGMVDKGYATADFRRQDGLPDGQYEVEARSGSGTGTLIIDLNN